MWGKYEILVTQIRSVTTRNLGQEARRKGVKVVKCKGGGSF